MVLLRRLAAIVSLVLVSLVAFSATTIAFDVRTLSGSFMPGKTGPPGGGSGSLPAAGTYRDSSVNAGFFSCCAPDGATQIVLTVTHTKSVANPVVGATTSTDEVDVDFSVNNFLTSVFAQGCIIPDSASDFSVNQMLSSAQLSTNVTSTTRMCNGQTLYLNGVTLPFTLNATWTASPSTRQSTSVGRYSCARYTSETQTTSAGTSNATATFSASFLTESIPSITGANIFSFDQSIHAQGVPADGCTLLGGKGAGPGPQGPGDYTTSSLSASMSIQPDDSSQQPFNVFVTSFTNTAHPVGGQVSTLEETDFNLFQFSFFQFIQDCWVIPAGDFTIASDLHVATLNLSIDTTTPACQFANNSGPNVFTINATWNATSPVGNFSNISQGGCGSFHVTSTQQLSSVTATATGSWPGTADSFTDTSASVSTNNTTAHVSGTSSGC